MEIFKVRTETQAEQFQNPQYFPLQSWEPEDDRDKSWDNTLQKGHTENIFNDSTTSIPQIELLLTVIKNENIELMKQNDKMRKEIQTMHLTFEQLSIEDGELKADNEYLHNRNNVLEHAFSAVLQENNSHKDN